MTRSICADDFSLSTSGSFPASAAYFESMDCIEYVKQDGVLVSDRIDEFLTVIRNENSIIVGFKIKGVRNYFMKKLQPALSLSDDDFVYVKDLFVALASITGDKLFSGDEGKRTAYREASRIASNDNVKLTIPHSIAA